MDTKHAPRAASRSARPAAPTSASRSARTAAPKRRPLKVPIPPDIIQQDNIAVNSVQWIMYRYHLSRWLEDMCLKCEQILANPKTPNIDEFKESIKEPAEDLDALLWRYYHALMQTQYSRYEYIKINTNEGFYEPTTSGAEPPQEVRKKIEEWKDKGNGASDHLNPFTLAHLVFWTRLLFYYITKGLYLQPKPKAADAVLNLSNASSIIEHKFLNCISHKKNTKGWESGGLLRELQRALHQVLVHSCGLFINGRNTRSQIDQYTISPLGEIDQVIGVYATGGSHYLLLHQLKSVSVASAFEDRASSSRLDDIFAKKYSIPVPSSLNYQLLQLALQHTLVSGIGERQEVRDQVAPQPSKTSDWGRDEDMLPDQNSDTMLRVTSARDFIELSGRFLTDSSNQFVRTNTLGDQALHESYKNPNFELRDLLQIVEFDQMIKETSQVSFLTQYYLTAFAFWKRRFILEPRNKRPQGVAKRPIVSYIAGSWTVIFESQAFRCASLVQALNIWVAITLYKFDGRTESGTNMRPALLMMMTKPLYDRIIAILESNPGDVIDSEDEEDADVPELEDEHGVIDPGETAEQKRQRIDAATRRQEAREDRQYDQAKDVFVPYNMDSFMRFIDRRKYFEWKYHAHSTIPHLDNLSPNTGWVYEDDQTNFQGKHTHHLDRFYYNIQTFLEHEKLNIVNTLKRHKTRRLEDLIDEVGVVALTASTSAIKSGLDRFNEGMRVLDQFKGKIRSMQQQLFHNKVLPAVAHFYIGKAEFAEVKRYIMSMFKITDRIASLLMLMCPRQMGKSASVEMSSASLMLYCQEFSEVVYAPALWNAQQMLSQVKVLFSQIEKDKTRVLASNVSQFSVLSYGVDRTTSVDRLIRSGNVNVLCVKAVIVQTAKGVRFLLAVVDEAAKVATKFMEEVLGPAMRVTGRVCILLSTTVGSENYFYEIFMLADKYKGYMDVLEVSLMCSACKEAKLDACPHMEKWSAPWNASSDMMVPRIMIRDEATWRQEMLNILAETGDCAFNMTHANYILSLPGVNLPEDPEAIIITHVDPSGTGDSETGICTVWSGCIGDSVADYPGYKPTDTVTIVIGLGSIKVAQFSIENRFRQYCTNITEREDIRNLRHYLNIELNYGHTMLAESIYKCFMEYIPNIQPVPNDKTAGIVGSWTDFNRKATLVYATNAALRKANVRIARNISTAESSMKGEAMITKLKLQMGNYRTVVTSSGKVKYSGKGKKGDVRNDDLVMAFQEGILWSDVYRAAAAAA